MAGIGPTPRDNKDARILTADGVRHGPELPGDLLEPGEQWHPATLRWWDGLRQHPLLAREPVFGWDYLIDTALLHHKMWTYQRTDLAAEVRLRVSAYAVTPADRQRMQIAVVEPVGEQPEASTDSAPVLRMDDRRKRLV